MLRDHQTQVPPELLALLKFRSRLLPYSVTSKERRSKCRGAVTDAWSVVSVDIKLVPKGDLGSARFLWEWQLCTIAAKNTNPDVHYKLFVTKASFHYVLYERSLIWP